MSMPASDGDVVAQFLDAMRSAGVDIVAAGGHPIADGKLHRVDSTDPKRRGKKDVYYNLHLDHPASGHFGDWKLGVEDTWTVQRPQQMTPDERAILRRRMDEAAAARREEAKLATEKAEAAAGVIMAATKKADPAHPYLARKGLPVFPGLRQLKEDVRFVVHDADKPNRRLKAGTLIVPLYRPDGGLVGVQTIDDAGKKLFLKGTPKGGAYHTIGKRSDDPAATIFIGEGYATGARVHEAMGSLVVVAFDSGNLKSVGEVFRRKFPHAVLVFAADNDRFTKTPVDNPGLTKAREAAKSVDGLIACPMFDDAAIEASNAAPRDFSDFDDLFRFSGLDAVRDVLASPMPANVVDFAAERARRQAPDEPPPADPSDYGNPGDDPGDQGRFETHGNDDSPDPLADFGAPHFRCLGVDKTTFFYQPSDVAEVIELAASSHKGENMMVLAPLQWWEIEFPGKGKEGGVDWKAAVNACIRACKRRGKFVAHNRVRGRGAWFEDETAIFHAGDRLVIDGAETEISHHRSRMVYDAGEPIALKVSDEATTKDAREFLEVCKLLRWSSPLSGYLLAGFCTVAPVCGFLNWRPHIWVNGPAGSGKSTVMGTIIKKALGASAITVVGATTEAGIRGALGMDALPVVFDEAEPRDLHSQSRIRSILDLARVAASEADGVILKGTSNQRTKGYRARSMFVFASINTQIEGYADETRFTQLTLSKPDAESPEQEAANKKHYEALVGRIVALMTGTFARRLLARTIMNLPTLRLNVEVFTEAATTHFGVKRLGDQLGPLLAGAYLLNSTNAITFEDALRWIRSNEWGDHTAKNAVKDQDRFLQVLTGHMVKNNTPEGGNWERTIGELIDLCLGPDEVWQEDANAVGRRISVDNRPKRSAEKALGRMGIKVHLGDGRASVYVSTTAEALKSRVLRGTEWAGTNIRTLLRNVEGARTPKGNHYFAVGVNTPYVDLPIDALIGDRDAGAEG